MEKEIGSGTRRLLAIQFADVRDAIRFASAPAAIGWKPGGWVIYDPQAGTPDGVMPELLIVGRDRLPVPLSAIGVDVLASVLRA